LFFQFALATARYKIAGFIIEEIERLRKRERERERMRVRVVPHYYDFSYIDVIFKRRKRNNTYILE